GPTQGDSAVPEVVLSLATLPAVAHLHRRGLAHVHVREALPLQPLDRRRVHGRPPVQRRRGGTAPPTRSTTPAGLRPRAGAATGPWAWAARPAETRALAVPSPTRGRGQAGGQSRPPGGGRETPACRPAGRSARPAAGSWLPPRERAPRRAPGALAEEPDQPHEG